MLGSGSAGLHPAGAIVSRLLLLTRGSGTSSVWVSVQSLENLFYLPPLEPS